MAVGRLLALLCPLAAAAAGGGAAPAPQPVVTVVAISSPSALQKNYAGVLANFSATPSASDELAAFVPVANADGCGAYAPVKALAGHAAVAVVRAGNCSAAEKALRAREAGLKGVVVVSDTEAEHTYTAETKVAGLVISVSKSLGEKIASWQEAHPEEGPIKASFWIYQAPFILDFSEFLLICLATSLTVVGAFCSTADLRLGSPIAAAPERVMEVKWYFPLAFFLAGSTALVVLYFLMRYLIYGIIFFFIMGGAACIAEFSFLALRYSFPALQRPVVEKLPVLGPLEVAHVIAGTAAVAVVTSWFFLKDTDYGWLFQDIMGAGFLCVIQRTWRMPSLKLAALLLCIAFFFDIFWVFISPMLFTKSVMVVVATGGGTGQTVPMLLRMPAIGDPLGRDRMVGFGDIALPGLLISFLRRHDMLSQRKWQNGYFAPAVLGYGIAMCVTVCALFIMKMGQPALLYLVPGTLGTTAVLGWRRGELKDLWEGTPSGSPLLGRFVGGACDYCPGGHRLQLAAAEAGRCDGCRKVVEQGERVMDCRRCNWYLCKDCRVQEEEPATAMVEARELRVAAPAGP